MTRPLIQRPPMDDTESSRHLFFVAIFGMTNCFAFVKKPTWPLFLYRRCKATEFGKQENFDRKN